MLSFKFAAEELAPDKGTVADQSHAAKPANPAEAAEVGSLLFQSAEGTRLDYVTNARQHGIRWFPELNYSVINAFADTWACVCCRCPRFGCTRPVSFCGFNVYRISMTRAQWLWSFNLLCFGAHLVMYFLCITACNGNRFGQQVNQNCTTANMEVPIMRVRSNWTGGEAGGYELSFVKNGLPVRFDYLAAWFHGLSALFHGAAVFIGPFDRYAWLYWEFLDNAYCWWRWLEYSASAPLMFFCLQLIVGIRDQSTLLLSWICMFCVMLCGWATELWSRPSKREADGYRGWVGDPLRTDHIMLLERKKRAHRNRNYELRPERPVVYQYEQTINVLSSRERNQYREQEAPPMPPPLTYMERRELRDYARAYTVNYLRRLIPHFAGWLPYCALWFVYGNTFLQSLEDVRQENEDLYDRIPAFVPYAIGGTALWFTSFTFISPDAYWKTEIWFCALSLGSKLTLGLLLLMNVLRFSSFSEAMNDTPANQALADALMSSPSPPPIA